MSTTTEGGLRAALRRPSRVSVPWDWTDIAFSVALFLVIYSAAVLIITSPGISSFGHALVSGMSPENQTAAASLLLTLVFYVAAIGSVLALVIGRRHSGLGALGWRRFRWWWLPAVVVIGFGSLYAVGWLADFVQSLFPHVSNEQIATQRSGYGHAYAFAIIADVIIPPLAEETFFRGFIYGWMRRHLPVAPAVVLSAAFFAALHLQLIIFVPIFALGVILALLYEYSGSLLPGAIVHGIFNAVNLLSILASLARV